MFLFVCLFFSCQTNVNSLRCHKEFGRNQVDVILNEEVRANSGFVGVCEPVVKVSGTWCSCPICTSVYVFWGYLGWLGTEWYLSPCKTCGNTVNTLSLLVSCGEFKISVLTWKTDVLTFKKTQIEQILNLDLVSRLINLFTSHQAK